ncbi:MAG: SDR family oxidoreductase [Chloroflexi bacterium]|nr:SDR family oxidoreductase [Chloroflexota bacterium]
MTRLLITGASGLLGLNLALLTADKDYEVTGWTNQHSLSDVPFTTEQVDLTDFAAIPDKLDALKPELIINCAAIANVDAAARDTKLAHVVNGVVPGVLADEAARIGVKFIHISTDAVFDGVRGDYREIDMPNPLNVYAYSKLEGELAVQKANPEAIIARVVFYGWSLSGTRSLAEFFYNHLEAEQPVRGYTDMYFTPLYVRHLAEVLLKMAEKDLSGTWHVFGSETLSKYAFGVSLAHQFGFDPTLVSPVSTPEGEEDVRRSLRLTMNIDKLTEALGGDLPGVSEGLAALQADRDNGLRDQIRAIGEGSSR